VRREEKEKFLSRWSRLKEQAKEEAKEKPAGEPQAAPAVDPRSPPPELPPVDELTIDSDFRAFFHPKVDENLRRAALKKLFADPHFNVMDGLDVYIDDYSQPNPLPAAMLAGLKQAQNILEWARERKAEAGEAKEQEGGTAAQSAQPSTLPPPEAGRPAVASGETAAPEQLPAEAPQPPAAKS
jgi:hypothetical protein